MIVHKFGGTSVGNAQCFANVADIVIDQQNNAKLALATGRIRTAQRWK